MSSFLVGRRPPPSVAAGKTFSSSLKILILGLLVRTQIPEMPTARLIGINLSPEENLVGA